MVFLLTSQGDSYVQLLTVLVIFVVVLGATALTTKWIASYQKKQGSFGNIELLDAVRLGNNKYIQLVRLGKKYVAIAVCKDSVTVLGEVDPEQLAFGESDFQNLSFLEVLSSMKRKVNEKDCVVSETVKTEENSDNEGKET